MSIGDRGDKCYVSLLTLSQEKTHSELSPKIANSLSRF